MLSKQTAKNIRQLVDYHARLMRVGANERRDRIQRVEQEVRIDLAGERVEPGLHQQTLLFLQLTLDAGIIPDLERQDDRQKGSEVNRAHGDRMGAGQSGLKVENTSL